MPKVLITGANRGLGLEFAKQYQSEGWDVVATARESSDELEALGVRVEQLDMRDLDAVAGFGDRLMFGTDQLVWPKLMELSIEVIDRASYLTPQQKRDILYNNAARFLRLDKSTTTSANGAADR